MSIRLAIQGLGAAFAPESYFREESRFFPEGCCFSIGTKPVLTTSIVAYQKKKYGFYLFLHRSMLQKLL